MKLPRSSSTLLLGGMPLGFVPSNYGASAMAELNRLLGTSGNSATYGWYAQTYPNQVFTGNQYLWQKKDIIASGAVLEAAVMPIGGYEGLSESDNSRAVQICSVMKTFVDAGVEVRLRFGHEVNWYVREGRYAAGNDAGVSGYREAFAVVAKECRRVAPSVQMWYSPSWQDLETYERYMPELQYIDLIGIDFYPNTLERATPSFLIQEFQPFHDKYTSDGRIKFAIGETGLHLEATTEANLAWLQMVCSDEVQNALPNLISVTYFNVNQTSEVNDYRILRLGANATNATNAQTLSVLGDTSKRYSVSAPIELPPGSAYNSGRQYVPPAASLALLHAILICAFVVLLPLGVP
ncbi:hypothetical protein ACQY0O_001135 [Thecaphora frezii]